MHLQSLSARLVQPRQNDDLIPNRQAIQGLRGDWIHFEPRIRSTFRTLLRRLASLLEFRADHSNRAQHKGILFQGFSCSHLIHAALVSQLSMVFASTRPACWN